MLQNRSDIRPRPSAKQAAACLFWLLAWELASVAVDQPLLFASPVQTVAAWLSLVPTAKFWLSVGYSFSGICAGFVLAFAIAFALAMPASRHEWLRELLRPFMTCVKATPVACIVVLFLIWLGSDLTVVASVLLVVVPAYYFSLLEALSRLDPKTDALLRAYGVAGLKRFLCFTWPSVTPFVRATSATVVGMSWKAGVAAELIGMATYTLGERVYQAKILLETADLFAWTATIVACAWVCERVVLRLIDASAPASQRLALRMPNRAQQEAPGPVVADGVTLMTPEGVVIQEGVRFEARPGHPVCVMGPSGIGKTTLLESVLGNRPYEGSLTRPARVAACFQESRLFDTLGARDNVVLAAPGFGRDAVDALLGELLPGVDVARPVGALSGGQRRRVELARALASDCPVLLLDEPFAGLDEATHERVAKVVAERSAGRTLVVTTHDANDASYLGAQTVTLRA